MNRKALKQSPGYGFRKTIYLRRKRGLFDNPGHIKKNNFGDVPKLSLKSMVVHETSLFQESCKYLYSKGEVWTTELITLPPGTLLSSSRRSGYFRLISVKVSHILWGWSHIITPFASKLCSNFENQLFGPHGWLISWNHQKFGMQSFYKRNRPWNFLPTSMPEWTGT